MELESHYYQVIYDLEGKESATELEGIKFHELDWGRVKSFCWFPKPESKLQVALVVTKEPGYRIFARKEGMLSLKRAGKGNALIPTQKEYAYYLGLYADDGSEYARDVERGLAKTVAHVDWMGGFKVFMPPDGKTAVVGNFDVIEDRKEIGGKVVQFLEFHIKPI